MGIFPAKDINGFAAGDRDRGSLIGVSQGASSISSPLEQIDALLAHELGQIVTGDMARMMLARSFQSSLVLWMLFSPLKAVGRWVFSTLGEIMVLGLSRSREFRADAFGAGWPGKQTNRTDQYPGNASASCPVRHEGGTGTVLP